MPTSRPWADPLSRSPGHEEEHYGGSETPSSQNGPFRGGLDHIAQNALLKAPPAPRSRPREAALRRLRSPRVPDSPRPRDPASRLAPAGPLAPLIARCSRPSSSRTVFEPARRTRPPAPIGPPRPRRRPVRLALLRFRCRGHLVQHPFRPPSPLPCTDRLGMPLRARSLPKSVHRRRCRHASGRRCVRGPRVPPSARRPERSAPPTQGRDTGHRFPRCKSCRRFPCLHGLRSMSVPDRRES